MRYLLVLAIAICFNAEVYGQSSAYGVRVGISPIVSSILSEGSFAPSQAESSTLVGFVAGADGYLHVGSNIAIGAQVLYLRRGYSYKYEGPDDPFFAPSRVKGSRSLSYIELPLSLRYTFADLKTRPHIFTGFSLGIFLDGTDEETWDGESSAQRQDLNQEDNNSVFLGMGIQQDIASTTSLVLDITYTQDLAVRRDGEYTRLIRLMAGISFW